MPEGILLQDIVKDPEGLILKAVGGLYLVETARGFSECRARGIFRKKNISPCAGDRVMLEWEQDGTGVISEILPRKNSIIRPPLANLDMLVFVVSTCEPDPDYRILDKFIAVAEYKKIACAVVITKNDLRRMPDISRVYEKAGIQTIEIDYDEPSTYMAVYDMLEGKIGAFTGNTGAGKSTLLNHIDPQLELATGEISRKLGRGRHTTRQAELHKLANGGYIADTPGFSTFDTNRYDIIMKDELKDCFREFRAFEGKCRFPDCAHIGEKGCRIAQAVEEGDIPRTRYESYAAMYEEAKQIKEWEVRGKK